MSATGDRIHGTAHMRIATAFLIVAIALCYAVVAPLPQAHAVVSDNVIGSVSDAGEGIMVPGARIELIKVEPHGLTTLAATAFTDTAGQWRANVPVGRYMIRFSKDDDSYAPLYYPDSPTVEDAQVLDLGSFTYYAAISLNAPASISGDMVDLFDDTTIGDGEVVVQRKNKNGVWREIARGKTDDSGHFQVGALNPGSYVISTVVGTCASCRYLGPATSLDEARVLDVQVGEVESVKFAVCTDVTAPQTASSVPGKSTPLKTRVKLRATDDKSGVKTTYYRLNGGRLMSGNSFTLTRLGFNTIEFYSIDGAGNIEPVRRQVVLVARGLGR